MLSEKVARFLQAVGAVIEAAAAIHCFLTDMLTRA
jgi:hypothetical protein